MVKQVRQETEGIPWSLADELVELFQRICWLHQHFEFC